VTGAAPSVLVSERAWQSFVDPMRAAAPDARWYVVHTDGQVDPGGEAAEVVWLSNDVFYGPTLPVFLDLVRNDDALRWVQSAGAGVDSPMFQELLARGVRLTTTHATAIPIAEYVVGSVLRYYQRPEEWAASSADRAWRHHDFPEIWGTTWLVIGVGHIGTEIATRVRAFGARVIGVRRHPSGDEPVDRMITPDQVVAMLPAVDVVVIAAPATDETDQLVDERFLGAMRDTAVLVNVARGALVDEAALVAALDAGRPAHAVLDVTAVEPLPADSLLWGNPRITITPHTSGGGEGRYARAAQVFAANLARYVRGEPLEREVFGREVSRREVSGLDA
jgi:phosphoglycerate dehydrogenase-like enzyme